MGVSTGREDLNDTHPNEEELKSVPISTSSDHQLTVELLDNGNEDVDMVCYS